MAQQNCIDKVRALQSHFTELVLTKDQLDTGGALTDFQTSKGTTLPILNSIINCQLDPKRYGGLIASVKGVKQTLEGMNENISEGKPTRMRYEKFVVSREKLFRELMNVETEILLDTVRARINRLIVGTEQRINDAIEPLSSIPVTVNKRTEGLVDSLRDTVRVRTDTLKARIGSVKNTLKGVDSRLQKIENQFESSPLYTGINWFTQNGLGFSVHYHITPEKALSPLAGITLLYQWRPSQEQDTAHNDFGITFSGGLSLMLSENNRLGLMADIAIINGEVKMGGRLMTYNQHFAVGIGYNEYMGADITLMIRFYDPRKKGVNMRRR